MKEKMRQKKYSKKAENKIATVMEEFKKGKLRSGSKKGPLVKNPKQALAIGIAEAQRKGIKAGGAARKKKT